MRRASASTTRRSTPLASGLPLPDDVFYQHIAPRLLPANLARAAQVSKTMRATATPSLRQRKAQLAVATGAVRDVTLRMGRPIITALVQLVHALRALRARPAQPQTVLAGMRRAGWGYAAYHVLPAPDPRLPPPLNRVLSKRVRVNGATYEITGNDVTGSPATSPDNEILVVKGGFDMFRLHGVFGARWTARHWKGAISVFTAKELYVIKTASQAAAKAFAATLDVES